MMVADVCNLEAYEFVHTIGDAHIYTNHIDQVKLQLSREPRSLPKMVLNPDVKRVVDFTYNDFAMENYNPHPHIKGAISV